MKKIKGIKKIIALNEELDEYDFCGSFDDNPNSKVLADIFIYYYKQGSYDGDGVAVWRYEGKWSYQGLSHCSCYGPLEDIRTADNAKFTLKEIRKVLSAENFYTGEKEVLSALRRYRK